MNALRELEMSSKYILNWSGVSEVQRVLDYSHSKGLTSTFKI